MISALDMNLPIRWRDQFFSFVGEADIRLIIHCNYINDGQSWRVPQNGFQIAKRVEWVRSAFRALPATIDRNADVTPQTTPRVFCHVGDCYLGAETVTHDIILRYALFLAEKRNRLTKPLVSGRKIYNSVRGVSAEARCWIVKRQCVKTKSLMNSGAQRIYYWRPCVSSCETTVNQDYANL